MEVLGRRTSSIDPWTVSQVIEDDAGGSRRVVTGAHLVYSLAESGITGGCGVRRFCPNSPVTRAQMATFLHRAFGTTPEEP